MRTCSRDGTNLYPNILNEAVNFKKPLTIASRMDAKVIKTLQIFQLPSYTWYKDIYTYQVEFSAHICKTDENTTRPL